MSQIKIAIESCVVAVPYNTARHYYNTNVLKDGGQTQGTVPLMVRLPDDTVGVTDLNFADWVFSKMDYARRHHGLLPIMLETQTFDVGLLDIQVFFSGDQEAVAALLANDPELFAQENTRHLEIVCKKELKNCMVVASALHRASPAGDLSIHYRNLIFGVRLEDDDALPLDFDPLLSVFSQYQKRISFIAMVH